MNVTFPLDIFLHVFLHLPIDDILSLRSTCRDFLEMTKSRTVWSLLYRTHVLGENIPTPGLGSQASVDSLDATELESYTRRAIRLRRNWQSPSPNPTRRVEIAPSQSVPMRAIRLDFIPNMGARWLISVHSASVGGVACFVIRLWDVSRDPPEQTDSLSYRHAVGLVINTDSSHPYTLAIHHLQLEVYSVDFFNGSFEQVIVLDRRYKLLAFTGSTLLSRENENGELSLFDVVSPSVEAKLFNPVLPQPEECHDAVILDTFALVLSATSIEIYDLFEYRNSLTAAGQPTRRLEPVAQHKWPWRIDSGHLVRQVSYDSQQRNGLPPIYILLRFGSWFPWPVNLLHHFSLSPNPAFDGSMAAGPNNLPYQMPPTLVGTIASPVRLFATTHMALGTYGTAIWIDTHTDDSPDSGQRLAGHCLNALEPDRNSDAPQETTVASMVFDMNLIDTWVRLALDEAEGRVAVGHSDGDITVYDYA